MILPAVAPLDVLWSHSLAFGALRDAVPSTSSPRIGAPCGTNHHLSATIRTVSYKYRVNVTAVFVTSESVREMTDLSPVVSSGAQLEVNNREY